MRGQKKKRKRDLRYLRTLPEARHIVFAQEEEEDGALGQVKLHGRRALFQHRFLILLFALPQQKRLLLHRHLNHSVGQNHSQFFRPKPISFGRPDQTVCLAGNEKQSQSCYATTGSDSHLCEAEIREERFLVLYRGGRPGRGEEVNRCQEPEQRIILHIRTPSDHRRRREEGGRLPAFEWPALV
jgi:hypothetical protein